MMGLLRPFAVGLSLAMAVAFVLPATEVASQEAQDEATTARNLPYGEDVVEPFVPLHPRTEQDRSRIDALRDYATARARRSSALVGRDRTVSTGT